MNKLKEILDNIEPKFDIGDFAYMAVLGLYGDDWIVYEDVLKITGMTLNITEEDGLEMSWTGVGSDGESNIAFYDLFDCCLFSTREEAQGFCDEKNGVLK